MILTHDHILKGIIMGIEEKEKYIYESILNDMTDGVIVIGFDGKISICNQAAESALDISEGGLVGKSVAELMNGFEENDEFFELILDAVYKRKKVTKTVPFRTNGIMKYLRVTTSFLLKGEDPVALIAVISDNTEPVELFICNKRLANQVINLMNSFVEVMVTETEERSAYNADHTKNMVRYANTYLEWLREQGTLENYTSGTFEGYVYTIVKNTCLGMLEQRNAQKRGYGLVDSLDAMKDQDTMKNRREFPDPGSGPEDQIIQKEAVTQLKQCIRALPKEQQDAIRLTQLMQYSYKEASVILNISEGTLKSRINRGMKQLKTKMLRWLSEPDPLDAKNEKIT